MPWKIREFTFSEANQSLSVGGRSRPVEPLVAEVLAYFCRHPDTTVSRDRLVEDVWQGRLVTDNAVNRVISRLRQLLDDDRRSPRFIATLPRKGYRFVAPVQRLEGSPTAAGGASPSRAVKIAIGLGAAAILLIGVVLVQRPDPVPDGSVQALTRGGGPEYDPSISPDGKRLAFSSFADDQLRLFLKDLDSQETVQISTGTGSSGGASWSFDGRRLVYLYTEPDVCQFHLASIDRTTVTARRVVHNCPLGSYGTMRFTHDPDRMVYSEAPGAGGAYSIFELDLGSATRRRLPQPELFLGGNSEFDVHPARDDLLIASPDAQQWLSFHRLELDTGRLTFLFKLDDFVCCPVWDHSGERVVLMGEHPGYTLVSFDLNGRDRRVIHRAPHRIRGLSRHPEAPHFIYVGGIFNRDIAALSLGDLSQRVLVDTSVDDRLATVSPSGRYLAYLSDRSGRDEIWLLELPGGVHRRLGAGAGEPFYYDLEWSPAEDRLLALSINEVHLIPIEGAPIEKLKIPHQEIRGVSWKNSGVVAFSLVTDDRSRVKYYDLEQETMTSEAAGWSYVRFESDARDTLWISDRNEVFYGPEQRPLGIRLDAPVVRRRFAIQKKGNRVYRLGRRSHRWELSEFMLGEFAGGLEESRILFSAQTPSKFSLDSSAVYFAPLVHHSADVFRTR